MKSKAKRKKAKKMNSNRCFSINGKTSGERGFSPRNQPKCQQFCKDKDSLVYGKHCPLPDQECSSCPLNGKTIALIGGLDRLEPTYRQMVDEMGGTLLFHTGRMKGGSGRMRLTVNKADLVVFITSINSHGALATVKSECKRAGKRFCALKQTGAKSFARAVQGMAA
ncbi:DUF2325 domain-containing protein [Dethiosulfatarculus sandiegensis]|uniref:DUF2325 domain-containing protein n=1 Tax=Dethiosulfatarculus sandiegensis TaxID=1429043 RepID=A0A0D2GCX6_9BACT|nr:DUF2325 domain-containing protein [Dethiosulfatarculus sandiegensis]KIX12822.1 hypothetical protein X474_16945 [Dethiosulfatarculus sandiegensis]